MNETKTKPVIETWPVLREAVKVWRETAIRQCYGSVVEGDSRCAIWALGGNGSWAAKNYAIPFGKGVRLRRCPTCANNYGSGYGMVAHWNDYHRYTFAEIADLAEAYPHLVFKEAS